MAKIINIPVFEKGSQYIERTSQLINDGETGVSQYIEESEIEGIVQEVVITELQPQYHYFTSESTIPIEHGLDKYPKVTILIDDTEVTAVTNYPTLNEVVIYFSKPETGVIIIQ